MEPLRLWLAVATLAISSAVRSADATPGVVQPLSYGVTALDLTGSGLPSMALLARRDNFNAHGFDVLTLFVKASLGPRDPSIFRLVPVFEDDKEQLTLHASGGADCLLHDFRLFTAPHQRKLQLVVADRDAGDGFADAAAVTFTFYELKENVQRIIGRPLYYFELHHSQAAKQPYCDVGVAFDSELGLGSYMARPR